MIMLNKFIRAYLNELSEHIIFTFKIEITFNINCVQRIARQVHCDSIGLPMQVHNKYLLSLVRKYLFLTLVGIEERRTIPRQAVNEKY